ncbi:MAG: hypothetical protein ACI4J1_11580 [Ruminiclostridium sp.]
MMGKESLEQVRSAANEERRSNNAENAAVQEDNAQIAGNLQALQEIKAQSDAADRPGKKQGKIMGFFSRIVSYFKFNKKYKNGDMTNGENKARSNNAYENFLLARTQFQSGGTSYQAQQDASITMSAGEVRQSDASAESLDRMKTDGGDNVDNAAVNLIEYHNVLRLYSPKAVFKRGLFSSRATADYSSEKAEFKFMGEFRPLAVEGGVFHLQHEYLSEADKFGEIASTEFKYNGDTNVKTGLFFLSDDLNGIHTQFDGTEIDVNGNNLAIKLKDISSEGGAVTAAKVHTDMPTGIFGKNGFDFKGGMKLDDSGFTPETEPLSLGKIENYRNVLNAENASAVLKKSEENGSPEMSAVLDKWEYGVNLVLLELRKEGDKTEAAFDGQGRLHIPCPGNLQYRVKLFGKDYQMQAPGDSNEIIISDKSSEIALAADSMEIMGKTFNKLNMTVGLSPDGAHHLSFTADSAVVQQDDEGNISLTNINADLSDKGIKVNSAEAALSGSLGELEVNNLTGAVTNLSVSKDGVEFENISMSGEAIKNDLFEIEAASVTASKTAAEGLTLAAAIQNFTLEEAEGKIGEVDYSVSTENLSGMLVYQNKEMTLDTVGEINVRAGDMFHLDLENVSYAEKALMSSSVNAGLFGLENGISYKNYFYASAFHLNGKNIRLSRQGLLGEQGLLRFTFKDMKILEQEFGDGEVEITGDAVKATVSSLPENSISMPGDGNLSFSGGFGLSFGKDKKLRPVTDDLEIQISFPALEISAEKITSTEEAPLKIESITFSSPKLPELLNPAKIEIAGMCIGSDSSLNFEKLSVIYDKTYSFFNDFLSVGSPSVGVMKDLSGFSLGGSLSINSDYFEGGGKASVAILKSNNYIPRVEGLENIKVSIPKLATASIEKLDFGEGTEGGKLIKMENVELKGYKQSEDAEQDEDTTFFDRLCASASNLRVNLKSLTYDCAAKKFDYDKSDLTFEADAMEVQITDNVKGTVDFSKKELSVEYEAKLPKDNFPDSGDVKANNIPHLLELGAEITPVPFVGLGGAIFAGAYFQGNFTGTVGLDTTDKLLKLNAAAEINAAAGVGLDAYLMLGMSKLFNIKVGLRGTLLAALNNGNFEGNIGINYADGGIKVDHDPKNTFVKFGCSAALVAKLDAFVKAQLLGLINTDLYTFNLKTFNAIEAKIDGSASYDSRDRWVFDNNFTIGSDFKNNAFNPASDKSIISYTSKAVQEMEDLKNSAGEYERIYGLQDWGSEEAFDKSSKMQKEIFPQLNDIRKKNSESLDQLVAADSSILKTILSNDVETTKQQHRLLNQQAAEQGVSDEASGTIDALVDLHKGNLEENRKAISQSELSALGKLNPASVAGYMFSNYGIVFDRKEFIKITDRYYDLRYRLNQAYKRNSVGSNAEKSRNEYMQNYKDFVKTKDEGIDAYLKKNDSSFSKLQDSNEELVKINDKINELVPQFGDNMEQLESYYALDKLNGSRETRKAMTAAQKEQLAKYRDEESTPIKKDIRKKFHSYKKLLDKKSELLESISALRSSLSSEENEQVMASLAKQNQEFEFNRSDLNSFTDTVIHDASTKVDSVYTHDISFLENEGEENKFRDISLLIQMYPQLSDTIKSIDNYSVNSFEHFKIISNAALALNAKENMDFYLDQFGKRISARTQKSAQPMEWNKDFIKTISSSRGYTGAMKEQEKGGADVSMSEGLSRYTQSRIDFHEGLNKSALDTMENLKTVIYDSTNLYIRMNDLFFRLGKVNASTLTLPEEAPSEGNREKPVNYINSLNALSDAGELLKDGSTVKNELDTLNRKSDSLTKDVEKAVNINKLSDADEEIA